jgi:hypothetical protein
VSDIAYLCVGVEHVQQGDVRYYAPAATVAPAGSTSRPRLCLATAARLDFDVSCRPERSEGRAPRSCEGHAPRGMPLTPQRAPCPSSRLLKSFQVSLFGSTPQLRTLGGSCDQRATQAGREDRAVSCSRFLCRVRRDATKEQYAHSAVRDQLPVCAAEAKKLGNIGGWPTETVHYSRWQALAHAIGLRREVASGE